MLTCCQKNSLFQAGSLKFYVFCFLFQHAGSDAKSSSYLGQNEKRLLCVLHWQNTSSSKAHCQEKQKLLNVLLLISVWNVDHGGTLKTMSEITSVNHYKYCVIIKCGTFSNDVRPTWTGCITFTFIFIISSQFIASFSCQALTTVSCNITLQLCKLLNRTFSILTDGRNIQSCHILGLRAWLFGFDNIFTAYLL